MGVIVVAEKERFRFFDDDIPARAVRKHLVYIGFQAFIEFFKARFFKV
jgi:hypothetical protein